jgi:hypothetical protein
MEAKTKLIPLTESQVTILNELLFAERRNILSEPFKIFEYVDQLNALIEIMDQYEEEFFNERVKAK